MSLEKPQRHTIDVDALQRQLSVRQVAAYYGFTLPEQFGDADVAAVRGMERITRNISDIEVTDRQALEHVIGQRLSENQQIIIQVMTGADL